MKPLLTIGGRLLEPHSRQARGYLITNTWAPSASGVGAD
jgi:hypothetical protein